MQIRASATATRGRRHRAGPDFAGMSWAVSVAALWLPLGSVGVWERGRRAGTDRQGHAVEVASLPDTSGPSCPVTTQPPEIRARRSTRDARCQPQRPSLAMARTDRPFAFSLAIPCDHPSNRRQVASWQSLSNAPGLGDHRGLASKRRFNPSRPWPWHWRGRPSPDAGSSLS